MFEHVGFAIYCSWHYYNQMEISDFIMHNNIFHVDYYSVEAIFGCHNFQQGDNGRFKF